MFQDWGADGRDREQRLRRQNMEHLAVLRNQMENQRQRKRRERLGLEQSAQQRFIPVDPTASDDPVAGAGFVAKLPSIGVPPSGSVHSPKAKSAHLPRMLELPVGPSPQPQQPSQPASALSAHAAYPTEAYQENSRYANASPPAVLQHQKQHLPSAEAPLPQRSRVAESDHPSGPALVQIDDDAGGVDSKPPKPTGGFVSVDETAHTPVGGIASAPADVMARLQQLELRVEKADQANEALRSEATGLRAALEAALRVSDEKLNAEIRQRTEVQLAVHSMNVLAEKERQASNAVAESLRLSVGRLEAAVKQSEEQQRLLAQGLEVAQEAQAETRSLEQELAAARSEAAGRGAALEQRAAATAEELAQVREFLSANIDHVDEKLQERATAISKLSEHEAASAEAAAQQSAALQQRLDALEASAKEATRAFEAHRAEALDADARAQAAATALQQSLDAAKADAEARQQQLMGKVQRELEVRQRAEETLREMIRAQHMQQGQLEDVGVSVQVANARTFEDLKAAVHAVDSALGTERGVRDEAIAEVQRSIVREAEARREATEVAEAKAGEAQAALEQVLRTEIKARMRGEANVQQQQREAIAEVTNAHRALQGDLQESVAAMRGQVLEAVRESAALSARTEEALARWAEKQKSVDQAHELAIKAVTTELQSQLKVSAVARAELTRSIRSELERRDKEHQTELRQVREELHATMRAATDEMAEALGETSKLLLSKVEELQEALAEEGSERRSSVEELHVEFEVRGIVARMVAAVEQAEAAEAIESNMLALSEARVVTRAELAAATSLHNSELQRVDAALSTHDGELRTLRAEAAATLGKLASERVERQAELTELSATADVAVAAEAEARASERSMNEVSAVVDRLVAGVIEAEADQRAELLEAALAEQRAAHGLAVESAMQQLSSADFTLQHNLRALREALSGAMESSEEGLRDLEQHCAHQLQHGLEALGANLEGMIENGVALEAMARQNADAQLAASTTAQLESLESLVMEQGAAQHEAADELREAAEVNACVATLIATVEESDRADQASQVASVLSAAVASLQASHEHLSEDFEQRSARLASAISDGAEAHTMGTARMDEALSQLKDEQRRQAEEIVLFDDRHTGSIQREREERLAATNEILVSIAEAQASVEASLAATSHTVVDSTLRGLMQEIVLQLEMESAAADAVSRHAELCAIVEAEGRRLDDVQLEERNAQAVAQRELRSTMLEAIAREEAARQAADAQQQDRLDSQRTELEQRMSKDAESHAAALERLSTEVAIEASVDRLAVSAAEAAGQDSLRSSLNALESTMGQRIHAAFADVRDEVHRNIESERARQVEQHAEMKAALEAEREARRQKLLEAKAEAEVAETLERLIETVEALAAVDTDEAEAAQLQWLHEAMMMQRDHAAQEIARIDAELSKHSSVSDVAVARLGARIDKIKEVQETVLKEAREAMENEVAEQEASLRRQLEEVRAELRSAVDTAEASRAHSAEESRLGQSALTAVTAEVAGLKAGLGLAGMSEPLARAAQLHKVEERVEKQLAQVRSELDGARERFTRAAERMLLHAEEATLRAEAERQKREAEEATKRAEAEELAKRHSAATAARAAEEAAQRLGGYDG